ncbi:MAG: enoyl-ACP reductase [Planctomycetota bacterium]|nr:enoyl-ACP reductase [Planctomycetota bacterium]MDA0932710.1 enoyl-ACP reductase [Planctomycetota bacterium]MDA1221632.1 enoyl-ACP reductase [Planctomycetota bacterium]
MGLMDNKVVAIFGVANKRSIAWGITRALVDAGATVALNYQNDRMKDSIEKLVDELPYRPWMAPCDVTQDGDIERFFEGLKAEFGHLDGLVHSVAFAPKDELSGEFANTSWDGYALAHKISAWSLIPMCKLAAPLMEGRQGGVVSLSYVGSEKVVEGYNLMGVAKAALESNTRYLAANLGPQGIRVNAISAGPIKTVSAMGIGGFSTILDHVEQRSPLRRNVTPEDVGKAALFLLSDLASGVTGQVLFVDSGQSILGA